MKEGDQPGRSAAWCQIDRSRRIKLACDIADHSAALMPVQAGGSDLRAHLDKMIDPDVNRFPQVDLILQIFGKLLPILESALSDTRGSCGSGLRAGAIGSALHYNTRPRQLRSVQLPDLATPAARGWSDRARDLGIMGLSGVAYGLEALDLVDPVFGPIGILGPSATN